MVLAKKTRGRQRIEMKRIENEEHRHVTFSKRRTGVTKKATELATLCGVDVGVLVFSPSGRPFSYGNPSFTSIASRFLEEHRTHNRHNNNNNNNNGGVNIAGSLVGAHRKQRIDRLNKNYNDMREELDKELKANQILRKMLSDHRPEEWWWMKPVEELGEEEVVNALAYYRELHDTLCGKFQEMPFNTLAGHLGLPPLTPQPPLPPQPQQMAAEGFPSYGGGVVPFGFPPTNHGANN